LRATIDGRPVERRFPGKSKLAIFPAAIEIEGEWNVGPTLDYTVVFLNPSFVGERLQHAITNSTIAFEHDGLTRGLAELCREAASPDNVFSLMAEGWSIQALAHISRISEGNQQPTVKLRGGLPGRSLRRLEEYVRENLTQPICLAELSGIAGLSKRHFLRAFQESVGATPYNYVLSLRIDEAKRRLSETGTASSMWPLRPASVTPAFLHEFQESDRLDPVRIPSALPVVSNALSERHRWSARD